MTIAINRTFAEAVERAVRELASASHRPEGSYVRTPLLYPSGAEVVVRVSGNEKEFFVTDFGVGYTEAEMMGHDRAYLRHARTVAENSGVGFDEHAFFALRVGIERLPGAIGTIANCSYEAVAQTAFKAAERASAAGAEMLIERLETVFGISRVNKQVKVIGSSNHEWEFTASIEASRRVTVFEFASKHPTSVASVAMKMNDIARIERAPKRIIMVHSKPELGTYLGVLAHSANVVDQTIATDVLRSLAEAA